MSDTFLSSFVTNGNPKMAIFSYLVKKKATKPSSCIAQEFSVSSALKDDFS